MLKSEAQIRVHYELSNDSYLQNGNDSLFIATSSAQEYLRSFIARLQLKGFLAASVDTIVQNGNDWTALLYIGKEYRWQNIAIEKPNEKMQAFANDFIRHRNDLNELIFSLEKQLKEQGYALPQLSIEKIQISGDSATAVCRIDAGSLFRIDTVLISDPKLHFSRSFADHYLFLNKGSIYIPSQLEKTDKLLEQLSFVDLIKPSSVEFTSRGAVIHLHVKPKASNNINAIIGVMPKNESRSKTLLTGEATLLLNNSFGKAEKIFFNWQQLSYASPQLKIEYAQPFTKIDHLGYAFQFNLFKKDSSFNTISFSAQTHYTFSNFTSIGIEYKKQISNPDHVDTNFVKQFKLLPATADMQTSAIGIKFLSDRGTQIFFPIGGSRYMIGIAGYLNKLKKNNSIRNIKAGGFNYEKLYDTVQFSVAGLDIHVEYERYFFLKESSVLKWLFRSEAFFSRRVYVNEMFRIGGLRTVRGFDEQSILCSRYAYMNAEYRYRLSKLSYFQLFTDYAIIYNNSYLHYIGAGAGLHLQTRAGDLLLDYALGKGPQQSFSFRSAKLHIGFTALF